MEDIFQAFLARNGNRLGSKCGFCIKRCSLVIPFKATAPAVNELKGLVLSTLYHTSVLPSLTIILFHGGLLLSGEHLYWIISGGIIAVAREMKYWQ